MTALWFLVALGAIVVVTLAIETEDGRELRLQAPSGLIAWATRGNWPAKIGAVLIIVGIGALLRYALLNVPVPPEAKLAGGVVLALGLGLAASLVPAGEGRRALSLALGGAGLGVAYLTAYSAFALFDYLSNPAGLGLLAVTSAAAGAYAVTRSALSLAILSMIGAFLAPAFATTDPGPTIVYGYYIAASLMTLVLVALRGWHALIHLSFLFALAGGVFFAWTARYYDAAHASVTLPATLLLAAIHVAMPLVERPVARTGWVVRIDLAYTIGLPLVATALCALLAPDRSDLSVSLLLLAAVWSAAAVAIKLLGREGVAAHAVIAGLLLVLGVAARFRDLPWELLSLAMAVAALDVAGRVRRPIGTLHDVLAGLVALFGAVQIVSSAVVSDSGVAFFSGPFLERLAAAALMFYAGVTCRRLGQAFDTVLLAMGIVWGALATGIQLVKWDLATFALVVHWLLILVAGSLWIPGRKVLVADRDAGLLSVLVLVTGLWAAAAGDLAPVAVWSTLLASAGALAGLALRPVLVADDRPIERLLAAMVAPWAAVIWMAAAGALSGNQDWQFALLAGVGAVIATLVAARFVPRERTAWLESAGEAYGFSLVAVLAFATLLDISRRESAIALELLAVAGLLVLAWVGHQRGSSVGRIIAAAVVGFGLLFQANLMRLLGPPGELDLGDVLDLRWPAVLSLVWAFCGCGLTIVARRIGSRTAWVGGAALLVGAAVKMLLIDFGSLGQLANILAVIAAGAIFMLVGWLAPMPPAPEPGSTAGRRSSAPGAATRNPMPEASTTPDEADEPGDGPALRKLSWTSTLALALVAIFSYSRLTSEPIVRQIIQGPAEAHARVAEEAPAPETAEVSPEVEGPTGLAAPAAADAGPPVPEYEEDAEEAARPPRDRPEALVPEASSADAPPIDGDNYAYASTASGAVRARPLPQADMDAPPTSVPGRVLTPPAPTPGRDGREFTQYSAPQLSARYGARASEAGDPPEPVAGVEGVAQLLREGRIRPATPADVYRWMTAARATEDPLWRHGLPQFSRGDRFVLNTYVVLDAMRVPAGLYGEDAMTLIVPRGVRSPVGSLGMSRVLETP